MIFEKRIPIPSVVIVIAAAIAALATALPVAAQQGASAPGTFIGADLITEDAAAASRFYADLFGWDVEKVKEGGYAVHHKGHLIASISKIDSSTPEVSESFWLAGIVVEDVEAATKTAARLGAEIHEKVTEVHGYGRFAVIIDPQRAPLMLIEPTSDILGKTSGPGSWVWAELWIDDVDAAAKFYSKVIGYRQSEVERNDQKYHVFEFGDELRAGLVKIPAELENVEPAWAPYIAVEDLTKTTARVRELGGRVIFATDHNPVRGAVALILDPTGAALFIHQIGSAKEVTE